MSEVKTVKFSDYLNAEKSKNPSLSHQLEVESRRLDYAIAVIELRKSLGMTQKEFAELIQKPQSTIARIENGNANPTIKTLESIAESAGKKLYFEFK